MVQSLAEWVEQNIVTAPCGCQYSKRGARGPTRACQEHRYVTCGRCGGQAHVTPLGTICPNCTFNRSG